MKSFIGAISLIVIMSAFVGCSTKEFTADEIRQQHLRDQQAYGESGSKVDGKGKPDKTSTEKAGKSLSEKSRTHNEIVFTLNDLESMSDFYTQMWDGKRPVQTSDVVSAKVCQSKQDTWRAKKGVWIDVRTLLVGVHPKIKGMLACPVDKHSEDSATEFCGFIGMELKAFDNHNHTVTCWSY